MNGTKKGSYGDLIKKRRVLLKVDVCTTAKHKVILSWPYLHFY